MSATAEASGALYADKMPGNAALPVPDKLEAYLVKQGVSEPIRRQADYALTCIADVGVDVGDVDACSSEVGGVLLTLDDEEHHFEIEIDPAEGASWYYRNRETRESEGADFSLLGFPFSDEVRGYVRRYL